MTVKLGVIYDDIWHNFLVDLLADWQEHYETSIYSFTPIEFPVAKGRINPLLHRITLRFFLNRHDVVFFEWVGQHLMLASRLPHKAKIIVRLHSWELFHFSKWVNWDEVDRIILVSKAMQSRFNAMYPGHESRTIVLPAGKSQTKFIPAPHSFSGKIAMLGHIIPVKRVYEMVLMLKELHRRGYAFSLHLGGNPKEDYGNQRYYASLRELVEKLELTEYVFFDGWVNPAKWLSEMDIYVSNSYWEGQQNALIEAMTAGCYCLCHFWNGAEEILPEKYLFTSEVSLLEKIIEYAQLQGSQQYILQNNLRSIAIEKFDLNDSIERYRTLIESVSNQPVNRKVYASSS